MTKILEFRRGMSEENQQMIQRAEQEQIPRLLLRMAIDTATASGRPFSLALVRGIVQTAPFGNHEISDDAWVQASVCWRCLEEAEKRMTQGTPDEGKLASLMDFWVRRFMPVMADTKGNEQERRRWEDAYFHTLGMLSMLVAAEGIKPDAAEL